MQTPVVGRRAFRILITRESHGVDVRPRVSSASTARNSCSRGGLPSTRSTCCGTSFSACDTGGYLRQGLKSLQKRYATIREIRGAGLFLGVQMHSREVTTRVVNDLRRAAGQGEAAPQSRPGASCGGLLGVPVSYFIRWYRRVSIIRYMDVGPRARPLRGDAGPRRGCESIAAITSRHQHRKSGRQHTAPVRPARPCG
jgi:hypothetical protein